MHREKERVSRYQLALCPCIAAHELMYSMHAVISVALRLEFDDREDPIVEIAAPEGYKPVDVGAQIAYRREKKARAREAEATQDA